MTIMILAILFLATVIRSAFGFGEPLIAVPLLAFWIPVEIAAPVARLVSITVAAVALAQDYKVFISVAPSALSSRRFSACPSVRCC